MKRKIRNVIFFLVDFKMPHKKSLQSKKYFTDIIINTNTSDNLLDIITKASLNSITIDSISTINKSEYKVYKLTILVENLDKLNKFMIDLTNLPFTLKVERLLK